MSLRGRCACGNLQLHWQTVDYSIVPRACQCAYCLKRGARWVSKSGTRFAVSARDPNACHVARQGSGIAEFHECLSCGSVVAVTALIDGNTYGALNSACLHNPRGFVSSVSTNPSALSPDEKRARWQDNWCCPAEVKVSR